MRSPFATLPAQPRNALLFIALLGIWVMLLFGFSLFHQLGDIPFEWNLVHLFGKVISDTVANHYVWETSLTVFALFPIAVALRWILCQIVVYRKWNDYFNSSRVPLATLDYNVRYASEGVRIEVVANAKLIAATVGFRRPRIVLSTKLIEMFTAEEIDAIVFHEMYHYKYRHPLQFMLLTVMAESLVFLPIVRSLVNHYKIWTELLADKYALIRTGDETQLVQALLKMLKSNANALAVQGVHFTDEAVNYRIKQLVDPDAALKIPYCESRAFFISAGALCTMIAILWVGCI